MFTPQVSECFLLFLFSLNSIFIVLWSDTIFYICKQLHCGIKYGLFWRKFHGLLRRMYVVLLQDADSVEIFQVHLIYGVIQV
jgi:hypothetical protein